ncbi:MAG: trigger factor [Flavobacteriaceae bacterium]|jgi:trigger factor
MEITKKDIDSLNAVLTVAVKEEDYSGKVQKILTDYRKTANIPGFRKGHVPMGMVKKQYGKSVLVEEVNKILQEALHNYLTEEKLDVLGNPLPKNDTQIDWDTPDFSFDFELGLSPQFEVDVVGKKAINHYNIVADDKMINDQVTSIRKQYGKLIAKNEVEKNDEITGVFTSEEKGIDKNTSFPLEIIKGKTQVKKFIGAKVGDVLVLKTKGLFADDHQNQTYLDVSNDEAQGLDIEVNFEIKEVNQREMAELNQDFFDKIFGKDLVKTEKELKAKIKEDAERQFVQQSDQKLMDEVVESLISNTKFDLPGEFLTRWIQSSGEKPMTEEEAKVEYEKSEKGLRFQLIEGKIRKDNDIQVSFEELKDHSKNLIRGQMAQYGQANPSEEELDSIAARIMSNQEEVKKLSEQLNSQKLLKFFKETTKLKTKEITYDKFIKEAYS